MLILHLQDILASKSDSFSGFANLFNRKYFSISIPVFKMLNLNGDKSVKIIIQRPTQKSIVRSIEYLNFRLDI